MQNKAKIIIPLVVLIVIIIAVVSNLLKTTIFVQWEPVPFQSSNGNVKLKVYIENSGSMDGYMCQKSEFKDAVKSYVNALDLQVDTTEFYYINSIVSPFKVDITHLQNALTPDSFAKSVGNKSNSDIADMIANVVARTTTNSVSLFVSDCILDVPQGNAIDYFGLKQTDITRTFVKALRKNPNLGVEIIRLTSSYQGMYYYSKGCEPIEAKRPYYIWIIGDKKLIGRLNKKVSLSTIQHGYDNYVAYSTPTCVPFDISTTSKKHLIKGKLNTAGQYEFDLMVDLSATLQEEPVLMASQNYISRTGRSVCIDRVEKVKDGSEYTHILTLAISKNAKPALETISLAPPVIPSWIGTVNDDSGSNIQKNMNKTTGIKYLIKGVSDAYKDYSKLATIDFRIKNK